MKGEAVRGTQYLRRVHKKKEPNGNKILTRHQSYMPANRAITLTTSGGHCLVLECKVCTFCTVLPVYRFIRGASRRGAAAPAGSLAVATSKPAASERCVWSNRLHRRQPAAASAPPPCGGPRFTAWSSTPAFMLHLGDWRTLLCQRFFNTNGSNGLSLREA
jgi:hypothetical protein